MFRVKTFDPPLSQASLAHTVLIIMRLNSHIFILLAKNVLKTTNARQTWAVMAELSGHSELQIMPLSIGTNNVVLTHISLNVTK